MIHEATQHEHSAFITLTFDDEALEESISKRTAQLFIKRLRQYIGKPIRYFLSGEYGDQTGRAHYHAIIFGFETCGECKVCTKIDRARGKIPKPETDCDSLLKAWTDGMVQAGTVTPASTRYVADYLQKDTRPQAYQGRTPPFSLKSQGLGRDWAEKNIDLKKAATGLNKGLTVTPVPRYYLAKLLERSESPEMDEFVIKAARSQTALRIDKHRDDFWITRNRSPVHAKYKADIQADREKAAHDASRSTKL